MEQTQEHLITAQANFIACDSAGDEWEMQVRIYSPEPDPESEGGDFRCQHEISGFLESTFAYGIDSLQALGLALGHIRQEMEQLASEGWTFYHPQDDSEPLSYPFLYCGDQSAAPWLPG